MPCIPSINQFYLYLFQLIIFYCIFPSSLPSPEFNQLLSPIWMTVIVSKCISPIHFGFSKKLEQSVGNTNLTISYLYEQHLNDSLCFLGYKTKAHTVAYNVLHGLAPAALTSCSHRALPAFSPSLRHSSFISWMHQAPCLHQTALASAVSHATTVCFSRGALFA